MKIEDYLESLPGNILTGEGISMTEESLRKIFRLAGLGNDDVFYHLGCGDWKGVSIAMREFNVKKAVGIDNNPTKIKDAKRITANNGQQGGFICGNVVDVDMSDATVILFWFMDDKIIDQMMKKFESLVPGTKIVTLWGPLPECLPYKVEFPFIVNRIPLKKAASVQEQLQSVLGVKCIDFVAAWEFAERYIKSVAGSKIHNDRFLTIIMTLTIWINAWNMDATCERDVPESIKTYIHIMHEHFGIEFGHSLKDRT